MKKQFSNNKKKTVKGKGILLDALQGKTCAVNQVDIREIIA